MILSDFLSCQKNDNSNPHKIIPISFNMCQVLDDSYYNEKYLIQMRSQAKSSGSKERPCIGQGRAGSRRKRSDPINQSINQPSNLSQKIPGRTEIESGKTNHIYTKDLTHSIKQCKWQDDKQQPLDPRCSLPSRSSLQTPVQTHQARCIISPEFTEFNQYQKY